MLNLDEYKAVLRNDFMSFAQRAFYELNPQTTLILGPHIEMVAAKLAACATGEIKRLIINVPPRSLKSHTASVALPAWFLGHNPSGQLITASYGQDLSEKFARDSRTVMGSAWYQGLFETRLLPQHRLHDIQTLQQGNRFTTSVGGVLTGRGADLIILDDPLKPDDALSETRRNGVNEWYDNTLLSRLNNKTEGCIIIIMQRLHQDDLVGHVLAQEQWEVVSFPAIAEQDEYHRFDTPFGQRSFQRKVGEALHPERESLKTLMKVRNEIGDYNFASQYQQTPTPLGGAMVKSDWLRYYEPGEQPARFGTTVQSWDTANKPGELNDYSVCTTWGVLDKKFYLLHVLRKKMEFPDLKRAVVEQQRAFKPDTIIIEDKASGTQLIQDLRADGHFSVKPYEPPPGEDKLMRLHSQTAIFENGCVLIPRQAPWLYDYVAEITGFPGTKFDDQVDSTTQALAFLRTDNTMEVWRKLGSVPLVFRRY